MKIISKNFILRIILILLLVMSVNSTISYAAIPSSPSNVKIVSTPGVTVDGFFHSLS